ncbi:heparinase II/III-family protein [Variovorax sp. Varisp41]|uniref:heparinase II/III family protein n=1 Tax=Variovorax sp. Varisp41 TaxID=3243033 RepID=UPI0039B521DD
MLEIFHKARTAFKLGILNVFRVASYKLRLKIRIHPVLRISSTLPRGEFFLPPGSFQPCRLTPVTDWNDFSLLFSSLKTEIQYSPPNWHANPLTGADFPNPLRNWWEIPDFDPSVGDIKLIWEFSRFDWVLALAQRARLGDFHSLDRLNSWLNDWCSNNPPYKGPNWKCGQEASIRVMHLAVAAIILDQIGSATPSLTKLIKAHLMRIAPTIQYAVAQQNNHGTSEGAALFVGGSWLSSLGDPQGDKWQQMGYELLEDRATRLIGKFGGFSQYSLNYHRLMLDTFCVAELWRQRLSLKKFSDCWHQKALAATQWLYLMINPIDGDGPNVGANDGARLIQLSNTQYRDYRPSVQLAMVLFGRKRAYSQAGSWNDALNWLEISLPNDSASPRESCIADDTGFAVLLREDAMLLLRYPRFQFRPSQADALHLDFWVGAVNLLRDAGSYSYNTDEDTISYFNGAAGHNTIQFDDRQQMPRLSRFLFGDWLKTSAIEKLKETEDQTSFGASYRDRYGARHSRKVKLGSRCFEVNDTIDGFTVKAVLRWRLAPGSWAIEERSGKIIATSSNYPMFSLSINSDISFKRVELVEGWESRNYLEKNVLQVLELEVANSGTITTTGNWDT